jgi:hypothetical protein
MNEKEANDLSLKSQNLVNKQFQKSGTERLFIVTDVSKNRKTNSNDDWMILVAFNDKEPKFYSNVLVKDIDFFKAKYSPNI